MEQIYTVKVKCRPDPGLAYPSERAYSSSTVGGLALAHLFLAAIGFTLCALGYATHFWRGEYIGGVVMIVGALSAGLVGLLACKRWYVDRHIRWFLVVSVLSCLCSTVSAVLSCVVLIQQGQSAPGVAPQVDNATSVDPEPATLAEVEPVVEFRREIYVHIFLASVVECVWSVLSVKIAWKGVKNGLKKSKRKKNNNNNNYPQKRCSGVGQECRPDILENIRKSSLDPKFSNYSDVVKELCRLQRNSDRLMVGALYPVESDHPALPLPESHLEYRQRIEKFLQSNSEQCDSGIS